MADRYLSVIPSINSCHCLRAAPEVGENNEFPGTVACYRDSQIRPQRPKGRSQEKECRCWWLEVRLVCAKVERARGSGEVQAEPDTHRYLRFWSCTFRRGVLQKYKQARPRLKQEGLTAVDELTCCKITMQLFPLKIYVHCWETTWSGVFFEFCSVGWIKGQWGQRIF